MAQRPAFLILGFPKCGTTAVATALAQHPDIAMSEPKETHFFDVHYAQGWDWYRRKAFRGAAPGAFLGEATPSYVFVPWALERIRDDLPDARFIVMLRNPVDRIWSHWWMLRARGLEPLPFQEAVAASLAEQDSDRPVTEERWQEHTASQSAGVALGYRTYVDYSRYAQILERVIDLLGRSRIHVELLEDALTDENGAIRRMASHIGVSPERWPDTGIPRQNVAMGAAARQAFRLARAVGVPRLAPYLPDGAKSRLKGYLAGLGSGPSMDAVTRREMTDLLAPDVERLMKLLGRDLSPWLEAAAGR